jgi:hypothetical protein
VGYYDIAKHLLEFAQRLFGLGEVIAKSRRDERERLATYLDKIATTIEQIRHSFDGNKRPTAGCAELDEYVRTLNDVLAAQLPDEADRFKEVLTGAVLGRGIGFLVIDANSREEAFSDLDKASGCFRALANRLRL